MRLLPYIVLAFVALGLQAGLGHLISHGNVKVLLPWLVAGMIACTVSPRGAPVGALLVGLGLDLVGSGPIGMWAVGFGVGGWAISRLRGVRPAIKPSRMWSMTAIGAFAAVYVGYLLLFMRALRDGTGGGWFRAFFGYFFAALATAILTAIIALPMAFVLSRLQRKLTGRESGY